MLARSPLTVVVLLATPLAAAEYDPLALPQGRDPENRAARTHDLVVEVETGDRRIPLLVRLPVTETGEPRPAPVVLFSHGLGGSRREYAFLGEHWTARGYATAFVQHPGSDESVWRVEGVIQRVAAVRRGASRESFRLRVRDVPNVLDQLERWNAEPGHPLAGELDLDHVGMAGHSFGAVTTQGLCGQAFGPRGLCHTDRRLDAAIAMSPSCPPGDDPRRVFGRVRVPWMLLTGTEDDSPPLVGEQTCQTRRRVFTHLPPGEKYECVLHEANHYAFSDRDLPGVERNANHHRAIVALTTAFWDAHLRHDEAAKTWLTGRGPRNVLEPEDRWRTK